MNQLDFKDRVAVITGGAQGIGFAVAKRFVANGARVELWDMDEAEGAKAVAQLGANAHFTKLDVTDVTAVKAAGTASRQRAGRIDILVTSAGITGPNTTVADYPVDAWRKVFQVNVEGTLFAAQAVLPAMQEVGYGRIVMIASVAGKEGNPNASAYSASKAAVIGLTKSLGKELAGVDIAVNCVTPAAARTRIFEQMKQEHIDYMLSKIPRGRFLEVDEAASMIAWLATAENSFTTGGVFDLSGGRATY
jgi:3-oxoacyl-[acyl-carrier protein] reductase